MGPFRLMSVGTNVLLRSVGLLSSASFVRCSNVATQLKSFSAKCSVPNPPKKPLRSYIMYLKQMMPILTQKYPELKQAQIIQEIGKGWNMLTVEQKKPYQMQYLTHKQQYDEAMKKYHQNLTPEQKEAIKMEKQELSRSKEIKERKKASEMVKLGKPKRPRSSFNIFMAENFVDSTGMNSQEKFKMQHEAWKLLSEEQKESYKQLAMDDRIRYKNEMKSWERYMIDMGREDLVRKFITVNKAKAPPKRAIKSLGFTKE
ncbi:hypothetical protein DNTS_014179 [Danionella cerebrum]|uniref:Transcription factor A, mitochondrial n=1 Tax=Danionella cerebrum TaxID=2873325 RepID=A0A553MY60_9TELE|nr:hypothetical protein DNTS_014179 [Danionella translucida]